MNSIEVFAIGSKVTVDGDIPATIRAIEIRGEIGLISYQCVWWDERNRRVEWVTASEIQPGNERTQIKFT